MAAAAENIRGQQSLELAQRVAKTLRSSRLDELACLEFVPAVTADASPQSNWPGMCNAARLCGNVPALALRTTYTLVPRVPRKVVNRNTLTRLIQCEHS